ncbi:rhamnan synthesis F family protein [Lichenicola sp.]|uniref:rhamnan synthesis F family protein n=1 Tax=Lichenicola sp. TaxID=2804529 RepID=UPI003B00FEBD
MSGAIRVSEHDRVALDEIGATAYPRPNSGLDFGAWQHLVERGCADGADTVLLANDSVFGPLQPLAPIVAGMMSRNADVWGMVESRESSWHLQSWFLCFKAAAFARPEIGRVLALPYRDMSKPEIVLHGELGLGAAIRAAALDWDACWHQPARRMRRLLPGNPMHVDFLSVMRAGAVPFIKVELLRDNPAAIPWIGRWRKALDRNPIFPIGWIDQHLAAVGQHQAPVPSQSLKMRLLYAAMSSDQPEAAMSLFGLTAASGRLAKPAEPATPPDRGR